MLTYTPSLDDEQALARIAADQHTSAEQVIFAALSAYIAAHDPAQRPADLITLAAAAQLAGKSTNGIRTAAEVYGHFRLYPGLGANKRRGVRLVSRADVCRHYGLAAHD